MILLNIIPSLHTAAAVSSQEDSIARIWGIQFYLDLMATTGSSREALYAGINPAAIPIIMHIDIASVRIPIEIKTGKLKILVRTIGKRYTRISPINPPIRHMIADSNKNSVRILLFFAPTAFFRPIIAVRSFTVTNIILAIPNAPTIRLRIPIAQPPRLMLENNELTLSLKLLIRLREKLSTCLGLSFLMERVTPSSSTARAGQLRFSFPFPKILGPLNFSLNTCLPNR